MPLTDNLISYWKLDEASGNALDAHGSNELTDNATVGAGSGKINGARDFELDTSEYFSRTDNASLSTGDIDFTLQVWVNLESNAAERPIISRWGAVGQLEYRLAFVQSNNRFQLFVSSDGTATQTVAANNFGAPSLSAWYLVHAWHDAINNLIGIAVNAGTADTFGYSIGVFDSNSAFHIGRNEADATFFDGLIDEVGFWKRVLTADERAQLWNGGNGLAYPFTGQIFKSWSEASRPRSTVKQTVVTF